MEKFVLLVGLLLLLHTSAQTVPGSVMEFIHVESNLSWYDAQRYCSKIPGNLFTVSNKNDLKNLTGFAKNLSWIGLTKGRQFWKWVDGSTADYFNWYKLGDCASIGRDGFWHNRSCGDELPFVCGTFPMWDFNDSKLSWNNANNLLNGKPETFAILHDERENGNLTGVLKGNEAWIGLSKDSQNKWLWVDHQTPLTYSNWFTNFLCAMMDCNGFWHDTSCFEENPFICIGQINSNLTYTLVNERKTWKKAQSHCEMMNMKLAMLKTKVGITPLLDQICQSQNAHYFWIGLYNDPWIWSAGGGSDVRNWNSMQPDGRDFGNESIPRCAAVHDGEWFAMECHNNLPFFCSAIVRSIILLSEHKSWEEALDYCRDKYADLASLGSEAEQKVVVRKIEDVQSVYVWTGLRFLAGSWFWVYGDGLRYENWLGDKQPQCPDVTGGCGALSVVTGKWEARSCEEKLEFLCFQK
ncbi:hypothetical protein E1301_Tti010527 [Triplophysa tibetana]|uniref:C-type lectin domain-containing protein n=1 Tax=Triplophysa tibetana TaxID=1572043 RepID=A0A5A9NCJ1_9TELE|nr:hypothetical protein E1301_Tti010527 [Triplophysa tibetana]